MKYTLFKINLLLFVSLLFTGISYSQSLRSLVNNGVDKYKDKKYTDSEIDFKKGLEKAPENFQAKFNLGDAQYKQQRYDEAMKSFGQALTMSKNNDLRAKTYFNIGNSLLKSQKYQESINAYVNSLKLNPDDEEAKYNLSYALNMLKQQKENKQQNNKNNKQDNNKDQQNQNKQDQNKNDKDQQNQQNQNKDQQAQQDNTKQQDKQNQQAKQDKNKMTKEEAQRILNAMKNNELDLQKKLRKFQGKRTTVTKDW
jgi:Ca-activated chloride channel family protein